MNDSTRGERKMKHDLEHEAVAAHVLISGLFATFLMRK